MESKALLRCFYSPTMLKSITIHDIARSLKISTSTVSRALNESSRISAKTITLVKKKAKELNYQPNAIATSLRTGKSHTIGVMIPSAQINFFGSVVRGIEMIASSKGFNVLLYHSEESTQLEKKGIEVFIKANVGGILASIAKETTNFSHFKDLSNKSIPLILFDRTIADFKVPTVVIDDYKGAYNATEHLINVGYKRIAHVSGPQQLSNFKNRLQGYLAALKANKITIDKKLIYSGDLSIQCGIESVGYFFGLKKIPDAVFAAEDYSALGIIKGLKERKVKMPKDFGVIGFANEIFGEHISPSLSTVDQQTEEMGKTAADLLIKMINSGKTNTRKKNQHIILEPLLKKRESTLSGVCQKRQ